MKDKNIKDIINYILVAILFILAFLIIYKVIFAIIYGLLLAYISYPLHKWLSNKTKSKFLSAFFVCVFVFAILLTLIIISIGTLFKQIIDIYLFFQKTDITKIFKEILPEFISSSEISENVASYLSSYVSNILASSLKQINEYFSNLPNLLIQLAVLIFTFFFSLKDGDVAIDYLKSIANFKKETEEKFLKSFKEVTNSVLIGQIFVGIIQGIAAGIGFFILGIQNVTLLTILTIIASMIPLIGAWIVWVPIDVYLFLTGRIAEGFGLLIYGTLVVSLLDNILKPVIVSKRTKINTGIVTIGMLGGYLLIGFTGFILGPLILSYVLLVLEIYKKDNYEEKKEVS